MLCRRACCRSGLVAALVASLVAHGRGLGGEILGENLQVQRPWQHVHVSPRVGHVCVLARRGTAGHARAIASRQLFSAASPLSLFFLIGRSMPSAFASSALLPIASGPAPRTRSQRRGRVVGAGEGQTDGGTPSDAGNGGEG